MIVPTDMATIVVVFMAASPDRMELSRSKMAKER